ncbi:hypothetical protein GOP47_0026574 [Adiantum capillus-veneris]|nr:hypothetical protein GOP47_0026574 [Adiantum capillus-veneris]
MAIVRASNSEICTIVDVRKRVVSGKGSYGAYGSLQLRKSNDRRRRFDSRTLRWSVAMFRSEQQRQGQPSLSHIPTQSWYPPSVLSPNTSLSRVSSASTTTSSSLSKSGKSNLESGALPQSPSSVSSTSFAATFPPLKDKSVEELRKLLTDKAAYNEFLHTLDQVKTLDILQEDLRKSNIELAQQNLEGESHIAELRNQCAIIRTMELAAAQENFAKAKEEKRNLVDRFSGSALITQLQEAADQVDEESERLHEQLLVGEIDLAEYIPKYRKLRALYHKRILTRLAATGTMRPPG